MNTDDKIIRMIGSAIVFMTFGVFGVWSYFAPLDSSAVANGTVVVKSHRKQIQHLDGGIVSNVYVKDGDEVTVGQTLLKLDDAQIKSQLEIVKNQWISLSTKYSRLVAERDELSEVHYSDKLDKSDQRVLVSIESENNLFNSRRKIKQGEISVLNKRINQISSKISGLKGLANGKTKLAQSYSDEVSDLKFLLAKGFVDKWKVRGVERTLAAGKGEIEQINSDISSNQIQINETELQIIQLEKEFQADVAVKLSEVQNELNEVEQRLNSVNDKLERTTIKATDSGMIIGMTVYTENGVITPGSTLMEIVPNNSEMVIEAQVSPSDIDKVTKGLVSEIRFSSFKQAKIPKMYGVVTHVSADRMIDSKSGQSYYQVHIDPTNESLRDIGKLRLIPGMPVEVMINTGERTLFQYLTAPISNSLSKSMTED